MTSYKRKFIDDGDFYQLDTSPTNVDSIILLPQEFMAVHSGTVLGLQTITLQGVERAEVVWANLDQSGSVGKYTVNPTTNAIYILVTPGTVTTNEGAKEYIEGMLLTYQMATLEAVSDDALYIMRTETVSGELIGETLMTSTGVLLSKMLNYDSSQDVNSENGYFVHSYRRALQSV
jgi:hypothetical protein